MSEASDRGWDFEFVDYEPESGVVVIQSAPKLDGIKRATRDAMTGWTKHKVTVTGGDAAAVAPNPELLEELIERALLFVAKFDHRALEANKKRLVGDAADAVEREFAMQEYPLHSAVQIVAENFGSYHGLIVGLPKTDGRGRGIYTVMYWGDQSGEAYRHEFHRRDLVPLVLKPMGYTMSVR